MQERSETRKRAVLLGTVSATRASAAAIRLKKGFGSPPMVDAPECIGLIPAAVAADRVAVEVL